VGANVRPDIVLIVVTSFASIPTFIAT